MMINIPALRSMRYGVAQRRRSGICSMQLERHEQQSVNRADAGGLEDDAKKVGGLTMQRPPSFCGEEEKR